MFTKKKNKYCCDWFSVLHQQPDTSDCIRVIKFPRFPVQLLEIRYATNENGKRRYVRDSNVSYRFFLMASAHPSNLRANYQDAIRGCMLSFCPCCGVNLYTFYVIDRNIEDYVNEIEGETF